MLNSVTLHIPSIPCYDNPVEISDLKKINIFYGLNGVGKTTFSRYFQSLQNLNSDSPYQQCKPNTLNDFEVLVFNGDFRETEFLHKEIEGLNTIITLSKPNVDNTKAIEAKKNELQTLAENEHNENGLEFLSNKLDNKNSESLTLKTDTEEKVWNITKEHGSGKL